MPREHEFYRRITALIVVFYVAGEFESNHQGDSIRETHAWLHAIKKGGNILLCFK